MNLYQYLNFAEDEGVSQKMADKLAERKYNDEQKAKKKKRRLIKAGVAAALLAAPVAYGSYKMGGFTNLLKDPNQWFDYMQARKADKIAHEMNPFAKKGSKPTESLATKIARERNIFTD